MAVTILRLSGGLDFSKITGDDEAATPGGVLTSGASSGDLTIQHRILNGGQMMHADSNLDISHMVQNEASLSSVYTNSLPNRKFSRSQYEDASMLSWFLALAGIQPLLYLVIRSESVHYDELSTVVAVRPNELY